MGLTLSYKKTSGPFLIEDDEESELAGELYEIRCRVMDDGHPSVGADLDFQIWMYADGHAADLLLRGVWVGYVPRGNAHPLQAAPINISAIRNLPLTRWEAAARGLLTLVSSDHPDTIRNLGSDQYYKISVDENIAAERHIESTLKNVYPEVDEDTTPGGLRRARGLRKLATVAYEYRGHLTEGRLDPAAEIARTHEVSMSTARTWIHRARKAGLLGPAAGRTPGEAQTRSNVERMADRIAERVFVRIAEASERNQETDEEYLATMTSIAFSETAKFTEEDNALLRNLVVAKLREMADQERAKQAATMTQVTRST